MPFKTAMGEGLTTMCQRLPVEFIACCAKKSPRFMRYALLL